MPAAPSERALPARGACENHPARSPVGRCAQCRKMACAECVTRLDGIFHCRDCLAVAADGLRERKSGALARIGTLLLALVVLVPALIVSMATLRGLGMVGETVSHWMSLVDEAGDDE